jgi:disulfide bond formation protein DsbB
MIIFQPRILFLLILSGVLILLGCAIYIEPFKSMDPCPMCMMQRVIFSGIALTALVASIHNPVFIGQKIYSLFLFLFASTGAGVAIRQLWLQSLPEDQVPACGPGIDYMLEVFPILEVIEIAFRGTGDCAKVQWSLLNISIPGWSLIAFIGIAVIALSILFRKRMK